MNLSKKKKNFEKNGKNEKNWKKMEKNEKKTFFPFKLQIKPQLLIFVQLIRFFSSEEFKHIKNQSSGGFADIYKNKKNKWFRIKISSLFSLRVEKFFFDSQRKQR